jgi:glycosyltransferase involved in cell wall biosynthesis
VGHGYREHIHARFAAVLCRVPVVIQVERNIEHYSFKTYWMSRLLERYSWKIVCVSFAVQSALAEAGFDRRKLMVIYNGLNLSSLKLASAAGFLSRENKVVMVARFRRQKDHSTLIRAFAQVVERYPWARLELVGGADGDGVCLRESWALARELKIDHAIGFLGQRNNVPEILSKTRIFVMSTHFEGLCGSVIEAMAAGCAVIGTNVGGVSELIEHGQTGLLVNENDVGGLSARICELLQDTDDAARLARNGQRFAEANFDLTQMAERYSQCFHEALREKRL